MSRRVGLGRHRGLGGDTAGDPLDGLVNLFDVGIVLAVAFLIAGLGLTANAGSPHADERERHGQPLPSPVGAPPARGTGRAVGTVYRLPDGRLVYVEDPAAAP